MNLEELFLEANKDLIIDNSELDREALRNPYLYGKYLKFPHFAFFKIKMIIENNDFKISKKHNFYIGNSHQMHNKSLISTIPKKNKTI